MAASTVRARENGLGRMATRFLATGIVAVLALVATIGAANAEPITYPTNGTQNEFVKGCRKGGGTPSRVATHVVSCSVTHDGTGQTSTETCNFNTGTCTLPRYAQPVSPVEPTAPTGVAELPPDEPVPSEPEDGTKVEGVAPTGGVLAPDESTSTGQGGPFIAADIVVVDSSTSQDDEEQP